jgi:hypothetical protein
MEERIVKKVTSTLIAAAAAIMLSNGVFAQNNTLATPTTKSPVAAESGYGTPGLTNSGSGMGSSDASAASKQSAMSGSATEAMPAWGVNNTLAQPTTKSPVGQ